MLHFEARALACVCVRRQLQRVLAVEPPVVVRTAAMDAILAQVADRLHLFGVVQVRVLHHRRKHCVGQPRRQPRLVAPAPELVRQLSHHCVDPAAVHRVDHFHIERQQLFLEPLPQRGHMLLDATQPKRLVLVCAPAVLALLCQRHQLLRLRPAPQRARVPILLARLAAAALEHVSLRHAGEKLYHRLHLGCAWHAALVGDELHLVALRRHLDHSAECLVPLLHHPHVRRQHHPLVGRRGVHLLHLAAKSLLHPRLKRSLVRRQRLCLLPLRLRLRLQRASRRLAANLVGLTIGAFGQQCALPIPRRRQLARGRTKLRSSEHEARLPRLAARNHRRRRLCSLRLCRHRLPLHRCRRRCSVLVLVVFTIARPVRALTTFAADIIV
mmetsp:Transcript_60732/g.180713  ORF Transcript_60732/g.180713 Transcript_60732/m.180713 type:complete len:384 (-) Transcript_60732:39-1190(-)